MLKVIIYVVLAYIVYRIFKSLFSPKTGIERRPSGGVIDEMVQDPFCKTYIPRKDSIKRNIGGTEYFFCSDECASKFELENKNEGTN